MLKNMKNNKGIALVSIVVYMIVTTIIISLVTMITTNVRANLNVLSGYTAKMPEVNKLHMYLLEEVNKLDNSIVKRSADGRYIEFAYGDKYLFENNSVYKNTYRIASFITDCVFEIGEENGKEVIYVNLTIGDATQKNKYVFDNP